MELILTKYQVSLERYNSMLLRYGNNAEVERLTQYISMIVLDSLDRKHPSLELQDQKRIDQSVSDQ